MKKFFFISIIVIFSVFLYAKYIGTTGLTTKEYIVEENNLPQNFDGLKILHFSDLLYANDSDIILEKLVKTSKELNPDIIVFTGDLLNGNINEKQKEELTLYLSKLKPTLYKYAILGDNDKEESIEILKDSNFIFLDNSSEYLYYKENNPILIVGGNNISEESIQKDVEVSYSIVLTHKPDDFDKLNDYNFNLVLAGHSLGGQIRLPFWGALIKTKGSIKYSNDQYTNNNSNLYISYGLGNSKYHLRLFNRPSINLYRLKAK